MEQGNYFSPGNPGYFNMNLYFITYDLGQAQQMENMGVQGQEFS